MQAQACIPLWIRRRMHGVIIASGSRETRYIAKRYYKTVHTAIFLQERFSRNRKKQVS